jgi:esterase/lipase superfamily enzyme
MRRDHHSWHSPRLDRSMDLLEFGDRGRPLLAFPTSSGRFFDYENFGMVNALRHKLEQGEVHLFCVDSVDAESFYAKHKQPADRIVRHLQYESYIIEEVMPLIRSHNPTPYLAITGNSFGGYHAMNFGLRHPDIVDQAISLGGAFDMRDFFDGYYDDNIYYNSPLDFVPGLQDPWFIHQYNHHCRLVLSTGEWDVCRGSNEHLGGLLAGKGLRHDLHVHQGMGHDWHYWFDMINRYVP